MKGGDDGVSGKKIFSFHFVSGLLSQRNWNDCTRLWHLNQMGFVSAFNLQSWLFSGLGISVCFAHNQIIRRLKLKVMVLRRLLLSICVKRTYLKKSQRSSFCPVLLCKNFGWIWFVCLRFSFVLILMTMCVSNRFESKKPSFQTKTRTQKYLTHSLVSENEISTFCWSLRIGANLLQ